MSAMMIVAVSLACDVAECLRLSNTITFFCSLPYWRSDAVRVLVVASAKLRM